MKSEVSVFGTLREGRGAQVDGRPGQRGDVRFDDEAGNPETALASIERFIALSCIASVSCAESRSRVHSGRARLTSVTAPGGCLTGAWLVVLWVRPARPVGTLGLADT